MKNIEVLIVEDDPMVSFLHKALLIRHNISSAPKTFINGKEALNFMLSDTSGDNSYLVLLDLNMPVMNGWEFLEALKNEEVASRTNVAIVTSSIDKADREKAEKHKIVSYYLTKPILDFSVIREAMYKFKN